MQGKVARRGRGLGGRDGDPRPRERAHIGHEIEDETDDDIEEDIKVLAGNVYLVRALTTLADFNEYFNSKFDEKSADTIAGIVLQKINHMPQKGEKVTIGAFEFKVVAADTRCMQMLKVTVAKKHKINGKVSD